MYVHIRKVPNVEKSLKYFEAPHRKFQSIKLTPQKFARLLLLLSRSIPKFLRCYSIARRLSR
jgi:hypothetical protein